MTSLYYLPSLNKYLGKSGTYTEEEIEYAALAEKEWRRTQQNYNFHQLLEIFPQAKGVVKRGLLAEIKQCKRDLREARLLYNEYVHKIIPQTRSKDQWFIFVCRDIRVSELEKLRERKMKRNCFYLSSLKPWTTAPIKNKITPTDIERAKEVPIETLLEINRTGFAHCPFHTEKTPSLKVYKNQNRWYCFGACGQGGDVIDMFMKINNCDFKTAVKKLVNK